MSRRQLVPALGKLHSGVEAVDECPGWAGGACGLSANLTRILLSGRRQLRAQLLNAAVPTEVLNCSKLTFGCALLYLSGIGSEGFVDGFNSLIRAACSTCATCHRALSSLADVLTFRNFRPIKSI